MEKIYIENKIKYNGLFGGGDITNVAILLIIEDQILFVPHGNSNLLMLPGGRITNASPFNTALQFFMKQTGSSLPSKQYSIYKYPSSKPHTIIYYHKLYNEGFIDALENILSSAHFVPYLSAKDKLARFTNGSFLEMMPLLQQLCFKPQENYISKYMHANANNLSSRTICGIDAKAEPFSKHLGFNLCNRRNAQCNICRVIVDISRKDHKFPGLYHRFDWTTAWEVIGRRKTNAPDKFFHIVPNEHIETIINGKSANSFTDIINLCKDTMFKRQMLFYLEIIKHDAITFASMLLNCPDKDIRYVEPINNRKSYSDVAKFNTIGCLYIVIHFGENSRPHMHLHCYVTGDTSAFSNKKDTTIMDDLFNDKRIPMTLECFRNLINNV